MTGYADAVHEHSLRPLSHGQLEITRAWASRYLTADGRELIDFNSGQMCSVLGHAHPAILAALSRAGPELPVHICSRANHAEASALARDLADYCQPLTASLVLSTGSEAVEAALALARAVTGNSDIVCLSLSYHGRTAGARSVSRAHSRRGAGVLVPGTHTLPAPDCPRCLMGMHHRDCKLACLVSCFEVLLSGMDGPPAAFIVEPVLSTGGIITLPDGYLERMAEMARSHGALLIADEAQTGVGRCGSMLMSTTQGAEPDVAILSKSLGGGYPVSAVLTTSAVRDRAREAGFFYSSSHAHDPLACAVARTVVAEVQDRELGARAVDLFGSVLRWAEALRREVPCVGPLRGRGLLLGLELVDDDGKPWPELAWRAAGIASRSLVFNIVGAATIRIAPPLTIDRDDLDEGLSRLREAVVAAAKQLQRNRG